MTEEKKQRMAARVKMVHNQKMRFSTAHCSILKIKSIDNGEFFLPLPKVFLIFKFCCFFYCIEKLCDFKDIENQIFVALEKF